MSSAIAALLLVVTAPAALAQVDQDRCNVFVDRDTYVKQNNPNDPYGSEAQLRVRGTPGDQHRALVHYDLGAIPPGSTIAGALAWFRVLDGDTEGPIEVRRVTAAWTEGSTWNDVGGSFDPALLGSFDASSPGWRSVDITALLQDWHDGVLPNHGLMLMRPSGSKLFEIEASEGSASLRPCMTVLAAPPGGTSIAGRVDEDPNGDAGLGDAVGRDGVTIRAYLDDGDGAPDAGDTLAGSTATGGGGLYALSGLAAGIYWVTADSKDLDPGGTTWYEQTRGADGALCANNGGGTFTRSSAGACYGGRRRHVSDDATTLDGSEHLVEAFASLGGATGRDFAFSLRPVVTNRDGDDDGAASPRTVQGSLRQFIRNANGTGAAQVTVFELGSGAPHRISLGSALPPLTDQSTVVDGTTQSGGGSAPRVELDGSGIVPTTDGLFLDANNITIRGLSITGFTGNGILLDGNNETIEGCWIGVTPAGAAAGNAGHGVLIAGTNQSAVGGTTGGQPNRIENNGGDGVAVTLSASRNAIRGNSITANGGLAIDLADDGPTGNDGLGDGDGGPNTLQNFPEITAAKTFGGQTTLGGRLESRDGVVHTIDVYSNATADPSGSGEAETWHGSFDVTTDGTGLASLDVVVPFAVPAGRELSATATWNGNTSELSPTTTVAVPSGDLLTTIDDGVSDYVPGGQVVYTVVVENKGPDRLTNARVDVPVTALPQVAAASWTCTGAGGGSCPAGPTAGDVSNVTVDLPVDATVTFTLTVDLRSSATGALTVTATASAGPGTVDPDTSSNSAQDVDSAKPSADLSVTKTDGVTEYVPGGSVSYTIVVSNAGPSDAPGTEVEDLVTGLSQVASASWTCAPGLGASCTAGPTAGDLVDTASIPAGGSVTYTLDVTTAAAATGDLVNTVSVSPAAGVVDPGPGVNVASDTDTQAGPVADLSITKDDGAAVYTPGGTQSYTIIVANAGPSDVVGATVADAVTALAQVTGASWTCVATAGASCSAGPAIGDLNDTVDLAAGASVTYTLDATIDAGASGTLTNTATVSAPVGVTDPTPANDQAQDVDADPNATVAGRVLEDVDGDADLADALPLAGVRVALFLDDGDGAPGFGDTPAGNLVTDAAGAFDFGMPAPGTYWLAVASADAVPNAGGSGRAEQSYGPAGALCTDGGSPETTVERTVAGPCYGGRRGATGDNFDITGNAEHVARVVAGSGATNGLEIGLSFNLVTRLGGGQGQGTWRRWVQNANAMPGPNTMRFVPVVPPTDSGAGGSWWTITPGAAANTLIDADSTVDGAAWDLASPATRRDVASAVPELTTGPELVLDGANGGPVVGVGGARITVRDLGIVNAGGAFGGDPIGVGVMVNGVGATDARLERLAVVDSGNENVRIQGGASGTNVRDCVLIGAGRVDPVGDGIGLDGSVDTTIEGNAILDGRAIGIDVRSGGNSGLEIRSNLIRGNGLSGAQREGIGLIDNSGALVELNEITGNVGAGIAVFAGSANTIRQNSIHSNGTVGIDLVPGAFPDGATRNDVGDADLGPNTVLNFPVLESAALEGANLRLRGFARPGSTIELFVADGDAGGFGEGETFVLAGVEGSALDTDGTVGSYGPGAVNGLLQGEETTNRFEFLVPTPPGVTDGTTLTATATDAAGNTSEFSGVVTATAPTADLSLTLDDGTGTYVAGGTLTYTVVVTNAGPFSIPAATVSGPVASVPQIASASWTCSGAGGATCTAGPVAGDLSDTPVVPVGGTVTYVLTATIASAASGPLVYDVSVAAPATFADPSPGDESASDTNLRAGATGAPGAIYANEISAAKAHPLYEVSPTDASLTLVGNLLFESAAIALSPTDGLLYFTEWNTADGRVATWDPADGSQTVIGTLGAGVGRFVRLGFRQDGTLFGMDNACGLYTVDTLTGAASALGSVAAMPCQSGDLAFDSLDVLYATARIPPDRIYRIDVPSLTASPETDIAGDDGVSALAFGADASLYAARSRLLRFDRPAFGETDIGPFAGGVLISDAASAWFGAVDSDLSISVDDGATSYTPGGTLSYTIVVANAGPGTATAAPVSAAVLALPQVASASWSCTPGAGASCTAGPSAGDLSDSPTIPSGSSVTYTLDVTLEPDASGDLVVSASVAAPAGGNDPDGSDNAASDTDTAGAPVADLSVTKDDGVAGYTPGGTLSYTIVVANAGPSDVVGASVSDPVTALAQVDSASWTCTPGAGASCTAGPTAGDIADTVSIPAGSSVSYTLDVTLRPDASGSLANTATAAVPAGASDPDSTNDAATDTNSAGPVSADLSITNDDGVTSYTPGGSLSYTIVVANAGPSDVAGATVSDAITSLAQVMSASWSCAPGVGASCAAGPVAGDLSDTPSIPAGSSVTYTLDAVLRSDASGPLVATASVAVPAGASDPDGTNDSATDTDSEGAPVADLALTKDDGAASYTPGGTLSYTIVVANAGPSDVAGASVSDPVTALAQVASASWTCAPGAGASCTAGPTAGDIADTVTIPAGSSVSYTLDVVLRSDASGALDNTATAAVPAGASDPDGTNDAATDSNAQGGPSADLSITIDDGVASYTPGGTLSYTIVVANAGPSDVAGASVSDPVTSLAQVASASWTCTPAAGAACTAGPTAGDLADTVSIPAGSSVSYTVDVVLRSDASGTLANTASVAPPAGATDPDGSNDSATDSDTAGSSSADLSVTIDDGTTSYTPGGALTYTVVVANAGPSDVAGASVTNAITAAPQVASASWSCGAGVGASCTAGPVAGDLVDTVSIPAGSSVTYTLDVALLANASGPLANTADVAVPAGASDPDAANDSATDTDAEGAPAADLSITVDDGVATYTAGGGTTYTIAVANAGPSDIAGATVTDAITALPQVASASWSCAPGAGASCTAGPVPGDVNDTVTIPAGSGVTYTLTVTLRSDASGDLVNTASVAVPSGATDPDGSNDTASDTDGESRAADLSITKDDGVTSYTAGGTTSYTIVVANAGPSDAVGATVDDAVSALPQVASASWTCVAAGGASCTAGPVAGDIAETADVPVGGTLTYTLDVTLRADASGDLVNTATVAAPSGTIDPDASNDAASDTDSGDVSADLSVAIDDGATSYTPGGTVSYTATVANAGPSDVTGAAVSAALLALPQVTAVEWRCTPGAGASCNAGPIAGDLNDTVTIPVGAAVVYTIDVALDSGATGDLTVSASVAPPSGATDPDASNDTDADTDTEGAPRADLAVALTDGATWYVPGGSLTYSLTVTNAGPSDTTGASVATVIEALPQVAAVSWSCAAAGGASCASGPATGDVADTVDLPVGGTLTYTIDATLTSDARGDLTATASVAAPPGATDPDPSNDSASDTDAENTGGDPSITGIVVTVAKTADRTRLQSGQTVGYTVELRNRLTTDVPEVVLRDTPPPGFTFVPGSLVVDGVAQPDPTAIRPMRIVLGTVAGADDLDGDGTLEPGEPGYRSVSYRLTPGSGAVPGEQLNRVVAVNASGAISFEARAAVELQIDPVFDLGFIVGKVFFDRDGDGSQGSDEPGLAGALVALDDGTYALTDEFGRYHFPAVATGQRLIKLDEHSLPAGGSAKRATRVLWLTPGLMTRADFAVDRASETVEIGRPDRPGVTVAGTTEAVPVQLAGNAETLAAFVNGQPVRLRTGDVRLAVGSLDDTVDAGSDGLERPVVFHLDVEDAEHADHWALSVLDSGERTIFERGGAGAPPATLSWDGRDAAGGPIEPGGVYGYQLALEWTDGSFAVSPRRLFGVNRTSVVLLELTGEAFETGSDRLSPQARTMLADAAERLREQPNETIVIEGHTDAIGSRRSNLELSRRRASAAMSYLVSAEQLPAERFVLRPLGESRPVASNADEDGRALNRRVEIRGEFRNVDRASVRSTHRQPTALRVEGRDVPLGLSGEFAESVLPGADDTLRIEAVNSRGRAGGADVPIPALAIERPTGSFTVPLDGAAGGCRGAADGTVRCAVEGRTDPGNSVEIDGRPMTIAADGRFATELRLAVGEHRHDVLVRNREGYSRVSNISLRVADHDADGRRVVVDSGVPPLSIRLPPAGARLLTAELPIVGRTAPGNTLEINGTPFDVSGDGSFAGRLELPAGPSTIVVAVQDPEGRRGTIERPVEVARNRLFLVAFADAKVGALSGDVLQATGEDDSTVVDGRLAVYLKGRIRGKYLVTAAFDSKKGEAEYLFRDVDIDAQQRLLRNLDPDKFYPVYGDGGTVVYDVESSGKLYLALDGDAIHALVGNFPVGLTDTELATYQRTVYGARFRWLQPPQADGAPSPTEVMLFANEVDTQHVRDELLATGGSLYYLSQDDVVEGSEQVTLVVRDKITGLTLRRDVQRQNADYTIKYEEGRLMFHRPVSSVIQGGSLVERESLAGHPVTLEVVYETRLAALDETGYGARVTRRLGERVTVGGTYVNDRLQSGEYELSGLDAELALGEHSRVVVEAASSSGNDSVVYRSDDGGLSYTPVALAPGQDGSAFKLAAELDVGEWFGRAERYRVQAYVKELEDGFAANGTSSESGTRKMGLAADIALTKRDRLRVRHDREERLGSLAAGAAQDSSTTSARWQRGGERWGVGAEYFDTERTDATGAVLDESALVATRVWWKPFAKLTTKLDHQATLSGDEDDRTAVGVTYQALSWLALQLDASSGDDGDAAQAGAVLTRKGGEIYLKQRETDGPTTSGSSTIVGTRAPLGPKSKVFAEYQWDDTIDGGRAMSLVGMQRQWDPAEGLRLLVSGETAEVASGTDSGRRTALSSTVAWTLPKKLSLVSRNGLRLDDRTADRTQFLSFTQVDYTINDDMTALVRYRVSNTEDRDTGRDAADLEERSVAFAYRPTRANRLNAMFRYTLLDDQRPAAAGLEQDRSWEVLSVDTSFRFNERFEWTSKGALRTLTERTPVSGASEGKSQLLIQRLNVGLTRPIDLGVEFRMLRNSSLDDTSDGLLLESGWRLHRHFRVGVGFNFTDFSDNVFDDNAHSVQGWFLRLQGIY